MRKNSNVIVLSRCPLSDVEQLKRNIKGLVKESKQQNLDFTHFFLEKALESLSHPTK